MQGVHLELDHPNVTRSPLGLVMVEILLGALFEFVLPFLFEMLVYLIFDLIIWTTTDLVFRALRSVFSERLIAAYFIAGLFGAIVGWLSTLMFPQRAIDSTILAVINLLFAPVIVGLIAASVGKSRANRELPQSYADRFGVGFTLVFFIGLFRLWLPS